MGAAEFGRFWDDFLARDRGGFVDYDLPDPKYDFLRYLREARGVVFHGSDNPDIDVLEPRPATGTGKDQDLLAVYATADPTTATFVAVLDRTNTNLTYWDVSRANERFAIGLKDAAAPPPWADGVVYILDADSFEHRGNHVSFEPVHPLGKLRVTADDLPNLDRIELGTSREENDAFCKVVEILEGVAERDRFRTRRDPDGYAVLLRAGDRAHPLCRFYFTQSQWEIGFFDAAGEERRVAIAAVEELSQHADALAQRAQSL